MMEERYAEMESILNKQSGQKSNGRPAALCLGEMLTNSQLNTLQYYQILHNGVVRAILCMVMNFLVLQDSWNSSKT